MIAQHKGEVPFVVILLPFIAGISTQLWLWQLNKAGGLILFLALLLGAFIALNIFYQKLKLYQRLRWLGAILIHLILFGSGWLSAILHDETTAINHFSKQHANYLLIRINDEPKVSGRYIRFTSKVTQSIDQRKVSISSGNLLVITPATVNSRSLQYGDELLIDADYTPTTPTYNPAEFNYKQYLAYQNIHYQIFVDPGKFNLIRHSAGNTIIAYSLQLRQRLVERLKSGIKDTSAAAVASTLMLGYKADLSSDLLQAYSKTGTIHVLSVSGAHVAIIYALITLLLSFLNHKQHGRLLNAILSVLLIWGYAMLTGFSPAVCRASLMISLFIAGRTFYRQINTLNILAASAFILLLYNPFLMADVGFQLSYFAVFGLLVFQPVIYKQIEIKQKWLRKLWYLCSASIAAQLIVFPLSVFYFHQFPVYFLISNLFILLPTEVIMIAGAAYLLLYPVPFVSTLFERILEYTIIGMNKGLLWIEHLPYASANGLWITSFECFIVLLILGLLIIFIERKKILYLTLSLCCLLMFSVSSSFSRYKALSTNGAVFFNLKKHSAILLRSGRKSILLTDLNNNEPAFTYSLQPCIDSNNILNDTIIHFNQDINTSFCKKKGNYVQFLTTSVVIIDTAYKHTSLSSLVKVDYLFITGSPKVDLNLLVNNYVYSTIIIDANNSRQRLEKLEQQAKQLHKKFICLKRNKSFMIASN